MQALAPVAVTGAIQQVALPDSFPHNVGFEFLVVNESAYAFIVNAGGTRQWLAAFSADVFQAPQGLTQIVFEPTVVGSTSNAPSASLLITVADPDEHFAGSYPISLPGVVNIGTAPNVTFAAGQTVDVGTMPDVVFAAGSTVDVGTMPDVVFAGGSTVDINSVAGNVEVLNAPGTKITSSRPPQSLGTIAVAGGTITTNFVLPADVQTLVLNRYYSSAPGSTTHLKVAWHPVGGGAVDWLPLETYTPTPSVYVIPILPTAHDTLGNVINSVDVSLTAAPGTQSNFEVFALFEPNPLWLEFFAPPFAEPNQVPQLFGSNSLTGPGAIWLVPAAADVQINLFEIIPMMHLVGAGSSSGSIIGYRSTLPVSGSGPLTSENLVFFPTNTPQIPYTYEYHGGPLPRGAGIFWWNAGTSPMSLWALLNYSLS